MIRSYFIIALRYFRKNRLFTLINLTGLAVGMAAFIIIIHYVNFEKSYDQFHENKEVLYRLAVDHLDEEGKITGSYATTSAGYGPYMKSYFSEVMEFARLIHTRPIMSKPVLSYKENKFYEENIYYADQSFLQMFSYPLIAGDRQTALKEPRSVIVSESVAEKYFAQADPMGKMVNLQMGARGNVDLKVTGVMRDFPANTHLEVDMLISFNTLPTDWNLDENLDWGDFYVYLQLHEGSDVQELDANLPEFLGSVLGDYAEHYKMSLQNITDIHLYSDLSHEAKPAGDGRMINLLLIVAIIILIVAWINYINLTTAKSLEYGKEVGLRKMFGANKGQLYLQYLINAFALNLLALLVAFSLSQLAERFTSQITAVPLEVSLFGDGLMLFSIFLFVLLGSLLSGLYTAGILSGQNLNQLVKGRLSKTTKGKFTKKSLVVFQFVISFTLIALTLTVHKQVKHMQSKDLGMNIDQTLVIKGPAGKDSTYPDQWESFVTKVSGYGSVKAVAASTNIPGSELGWGRGLYTKGKTGDQEVPVNIISTEPGFFILYDMKFASGRNFSFDQTDPDNAAILNEKAVDLLGFESAEKAIGQTVVWDENDDHFEFKIIGVIRNFNQQSPKQPLVPIIFTLKRFIDPPWAGEYYSVKFHRSDYDNGIKNIEKAWHQVFPDNPFDYFFLDSFFDRQYKADRRFGQIFLIFTALAILIANLGLLGLFSFTVIQRTKEIGIRKVLGATEFGIVKLLSNEYFRLILVAFALAGPIAYSAAVDWLEHFTYRISLGWWFFVLPAFVAFTMLAMTLALQVIKTARTNPVEALRYE